MFQAALRCPLSLYITIYCKKHIKRHRATYFGVGKKLTIDIRYLNSSFTSVFIFCKI